MATDAALPEPLIRALGDLAELLPAHQARYALIGGIAAGLRGRFRHTDDIDILLTVPQVQLPGLIEALVGRGFQCDVVPAVRAWVQHHMVVMRYADVRIDWLKPVVPTYQHVLDTASEQTWHGRSLRVATAEGLIVLKLIAGRTQDFADIENLLAANRGRLDLDWIEKEWLTIFTTDDPRWLKFREAVAGYYDR
jgi:hypothetical protein